MTNGEILKIAEGLVELSNLNLSFNAKVGYSLARNKQLIEQAANLIQEKQIEIYKKYGHVLDNGDLKIEPEQVPEANKELNTLMSINDNLQLISINIEDFGDIQIPINILQKLLPIIED